MGKWIFAQKQMLINLENAKEQYSKLGYPHRTEIMWKCSECGKGVFLDKSIGKYPYCPWCKSLMETEE